jgi:hypothetical protein
MLFYSATQPNLFQTFKRISGLLPSQEIRTTGIRCQSGIRPFAKVARTLAKMQLFENRSAVYFSYMSNGSGEKLHLQQVIVDFGDRSIIILDEQPPPSTLVPATTLQPFAPQKQSDAARLYTQTPRLDTFFPLDDSPLTQG